MEPVKKKGHNTILVIIVVFFFITAIGSAFYKYYYAKDYNYLIETACDTEKGGCFVRDCENDPDSCPPNMLSMYKQYYVRASDFAHCGDVSCSQECAVGAITCEEVICDSAAGDVCSNPVIVIE